MNIAYCKNMGGVDLNDQICQYYDIICKSVKWWGNFFFHLVPRTYVSRKSKAVKSSGLV
jgi:hypothetical protein